MWLEYKINGGDVRIEADDNNVFKYGEDICLSSKFNDISIGLDWYEDGHTCIDFSDVIDPKALKKSIERTISNIIKEEIPEVDLKDFTLEKYHKYVPASIHGQIIKRTRRLYPKDFDFQSDDIVSKIENIVGTKLSYNNVAGKMIQWIIVRINTPNSNNFNPAHKDVYEGYDSSNVIPGMINCWIPVCGVNDNTGLPVASGSHRLNESAIERTTAGSVIEGQRYSVNCIRSWNGSNELDLVSPKQNEMLLFSSHLIHGLGKNNNNDETRVSLEFRLYS